MTITNLGRGSLFVGADLSLPGVEEMAGVNEHGEVIRFAHDTITGEGRWFGPDRHGVLGGCLKAASSPDRLAAYVVARSWPCGCPMTPEEEAEALAQVLSAPEPLVPRTARPVPRDKPRKRRFR